MDAFTPATRRWFAQNFPTPTQAQALGWPAIAAGHHTLITAPTGSGKTLAAFLWAIDRLMRPAPETSGDARGPAGTRILYVSPLKALVYDIERNLRAPLAGISRSAETLGGIARLPQVAIRTGDTPQRERQRQLREPAEILVTTPESLFLLLGSQAAGNLAGVDTVILDEVHALVPSKRGAHLALSLERLAAICLRDPQRIGLSATVRPLDEAARFVGGDRPVEIIDAVAQPRLDLRVLVPVPDMAHPPQIAVSPTQPQPKAKPLTQQGGPILAELYRREAAPPPPERGLWSAIYPALVEAIRAHRSTIVFVNSRSLSERLCRRLNELAGEELVQAHHGSISHARRAEMEDALKRGALRGIVATSSLELGIDMGAVDQVLLVESPGSVARGLQRVGRAGHGVGEVSTGRIFPKFRGDLLECAVVAGRMLSAELEPSRMPRNALDVLAQQVVALCCSSPQRADEILTLVRRAAPYRDLARPALEAVLDMMSGRYPSSEFADLKPLLAWDRATDTLSPRRGAAMLSRLNAGTIPDRGNYAVHLLGSRADGTGEAGGPRLGELDEEMVYETKAGDCILLGASTWRVESIGRDRVLVSPAPGEPGRLPFWRGEGPGRPAELGRAVGEFTRRVAALGPAEAAAWIGAQTPLDELAAANLAAYIREQREATGQVPSDRVVVIERFRDEVGDWRLCILTPFGARIHAPWALALQTALASRAGFEVQIMYTDDGIVLRLADGEELPGLDDLLPSPEDLEDRVMQSLGDTALFAGLFRENAVRSLLMPRRSGRGRRPLWAMRLKSQALLAAVRRYPAFPVVLETYRQALSDIFDMPGLQDILTRIRSRVIRVHEVETPSASPFARSLVFAYVAAYLYEQDAPLAERRAQALTLDRSLLAELIGQEELRELIDPGALAALEAEVQHLDPDGDQAHLARDPDELHDLLRRLGDLTADDAALRCAQPSGTQAWLDLLRGQRRALPIPLAGETRWIAAEDAGFYRDALGIVPPGGLPEAYLAQTRAPLEHLLRRYARTHGPFPTRDPAVRLGLRPAQIEPALHLLEVEGILVRGEIRPLGTEPEWCDAEVLRHLRRRTLATLRHAVAPVDAATLGRFLPAWHGIDEGLPSVGRGLNRSPERLFEAIGQLEGLRVPWSLLDQVLLPARVPGYRPEDLDLLAASGQVIWVGSGAAGPRDGRIALYRREAVADLVDATEGAAPNGPLHRALLGHLARRGACFLMELTQAAEAANPGVRREDFEAALWDLVWAGRITNDTFAPLRALAAGPGRSGRSRRAGGIAGGRWSLVAEPMHDRPASADATRRLLAKARMLLERYGVVSREAVQAEVLPGGFGPVYRVLKDLEEAGRVRRGWFCDGLSGAQFALPGALERLRAARVEEVPVDGYGPDQVRILAAIDPANPYGALVPWPAAAGGTSPRRILGAWAVLVAGAPVVFVGPGGQQILTFPSSCTDLGGELALALAALHRLPHRLRHRPRLAIRELDGVPAPQSPLREALLAAGFVLDYDAWVSAGWSQG